jgi:hypothetical protein
MKAMTAVKDSEVVKEAFQIKLSPDMVGYLVEIDNGVKYANELAEDAAKVRVTSDTTNIKASEIIINMSKAKKGLEELRKVFATPLYDRKKLIDDAFRRWLGNMSRQEDRLRQETGDWFLAKKREAEERQRRIDEENEKAAAKARATGQAVPKPVSTTIEQPQATTRTDAGTLNVGTKFKGELIDIRIVPIEYHCLNEKAISAAINEGGIKSIPGIRIKEVPITSAR